MMEQCEVGIIGGGPAGSLAAAQLAAAGRRIILFDEKLAWEKPCGGALTDKALRRYPFLRDNATPRKIVRTCELVGARGERVKVDLGQPIVIYSRHDLNGLLLDRAAWAGAEVIRERIVAAEPEGGGWRLRGRLGTYMARYVVFAAGARSNFREFTGPLEAPDAGTTLGYYVPATQDHMEVRFLENFEGYLWVFPRADHLSVGIYGKPTREPAARMRQWLDRYMEEHGFRPDPARFYSHLLPSLRARSLATRRLGGNGWAALGDTAGLVDPLTGEGIAHALRSAELFAAAYAEDRPESYPARVQAELGRELEKAASISQTFYFGSFFGASIPTRMIQFLRLSPTVARVAVDLVTGEQGYHGLKRRLLASAAAILAEAVWNGAKQALGATRPKERIA